MLFRSEISQEENLSEAAIEPLISDKTTSLTVPELKVLAVRLEREMKAAAKELDFEQAARLRDLLIIVKGRIK